MSCIAAALVVACAFAAAPPASPPVAATPPSPPLPQPPAPPYPGGALELRADGKLFSLERPAVAVVGDPQAGPAVVERVDLVWGCRGDRRRALLLEGEPRPGVAPPDACVLRVDVRPPCPPAIDDAGLEDDDARALAAAAAEQQRAALAVHQQRLARLGAGFSQWGPGLRVVVNGGGPLRVTSSNLALDSCDCDGSTARALGDEITTVVLPKLAAPTVLWLQVPRYLGALHRLGAAAPRAPAVLSFVEPFEAEDDADEELHGGDGARARAFSAPVGCDCASCDE
ncbi:MAG: hypothetical protein HYS27_25265 [Deltaproteobacteria bacterium]|nr:hypothetical protein [Deltaproteobacteria bacterium]